MSQRIWASINPLTTSGTMLAALLTDFKDAYVSGFSGTSRPANLQAGGVWIDTTSQAAPNYIWSFKLYTGVTDVEIFRMSILNGFGGTLTADGSFEIQEVADDAVGPILQLIKNRIANNGQVLSGDVVGEMRFIGRTNTGTDPTVAYFKWTATDDMTTSVQGGTFTMYSTPEASSTIAEHLRLINGMVETVEPHKINSLQLVGQNVATAATISQLSASKVLVEMTGVTDTEIQGIESDGESQTVVIHNRSTATVTIKDEDSGATEEDRISLPNGLDMDILPEQSVSLFYCSTDGRWKVLSVVGKSQTRTIETLNGAYGTWTAPDRVRRISLKTYDQFAARIKSNGFIDVHGNLYAWGFNGNGQLGIGDVTPRSSPIAVLGGLRFQPDGKERCWDENIAHTRVELDVNGVAYGWGRGDNGMHGLGDEAPRSSPVAVLGGLTFATVIMTEPTSTFALTQDGAAYAWGDNSFRHLGVGDGVNRSSPVAVLGGLKFSRLYTTGRVTFGILRNGDLYAWGVNSGGCLGVGDTVRRSSPVAVLGGLKFKKVVTGGNSAGTTACSIGLTETGALYAWGGNSNGQLGLGDVTDRSSPVAVLGGLTFKDIEHGVQGGGQFIALTDDGTAYAWGLNAKGQLGVGDVVPRSSPVAVLGGLKFVKVFMTGSHVSNQSAFGLTESGDLYAWGDNTVGNLGLGDSTHRSSPVLVLGGIKWSCFRPVTSTMFGISTDGKMYAWGFNSNGQLALGDTTNRSSPVAVLGGFGCAPQLPKNSFDIDVEPGTTYTYVLSQAASNFGSTQIGRAVEYITLEYET